VGNEPDWALRPGQRAEGVLRKAAMVEKLFVRLGFEEGSAGVAGASVQEENSSCLGGLG